MDDDVKESNDVRLVVEIEDDSHDRLYLDPSTTTGDWRRSMNRWNATVRGLTRWKMDNTMMFCYRNSS